MLMKVTLFILVLITINSFIGCSELNSVSSGNSKITPTAKIAFTSTPTSPQVIGNVATLGGTLSGFTDAYGTPSTSPFIPPPFFARNIEGVNIEFEITLYNGTDHQPHVITIGIIPTDAKTPFDFNTATKIVQHFLPTDAHFLRENKFPYTIEHIYTSSSFGATFNASRFIDSNFQIVPSGTFSWYCLGSSLDTKIKNCAITIGQL